MKNDNTLRNAHYIYGVGINDLKSSSHSVVFKVWYNMIRRCYDDKYHKSKPTYKDAEVCEEWRILSNFKKWFDENYVEGYVLDKDILHKGNKIYSPDNCCFIPYEINAALTKSNKIRGRLPIGVRYSTSKKRYEARLSVNKQYIHLGTHDTVEVAFNVYKRCKELWLRKLATEYYNGGHINQRVYDALMNYKVEITD